MKAIPRVAAPRLIEVACWSHARRKIYDVHVDTGSPLAKEALERIAELFAIEADISGRPPAERLAVREVQSVPRLGELERFLRAALSQISGKSTLAGAIRYALSRWDALTRYTCDGRLEMSNNAAERAIRPLVLGRKNYLFAGSDSGGVRAAKMYTIIQSAKLNQLDPEAYLRDIFASHRRPPDQPDRRIASMAVDAHCVEDRGLIRRTRDTDQVGTSDAYRDPIARGYPSRGWARFRIYWANRTRQRGRAR